MYVLPSCSNVTLETRQICHVRSRPSFAFLLKFEFEVRMYRLLSAIENALQHSVFCTFTIKEYELLYCAHEYGFIICALTRTTASFTYFNLDLSTRSFGSRFDQNQRSVDWHIFQLSHPCCRARSCRSDGVHPLDV